MKRIAIIVGGYGHDVQLLDDHLRNLNYNVILKGLYPLYCIMMSSPNQELSRKVIRALGLKLY